MDEILKNLEENNKVWHGKTLIEKLEKSEEDIAAGRVISFSDFKEKLQKMYNTNFGSQNI